MNKGGIIMLVIAAIVFCGLGFVIGQWAKAASVPTPGGKDDPLVSKNYVDKLVAERTADLQNQLDELMAQFLAMGGSLDIPIDNSNDNNDTPAVVTPPPGPTYTSVKITTNGARVRSQPNTTSDVLITLNSGDVVDYLGEENDFYKIKLPDGREGYIATWLGTKQ
jgi:uncharacterized protein YgiM (DUF1202 family)